MTEIRFYHLQRRPESHVLPVLLTKALERGHRIVVKMNDEMELQRMNDHLWSFHPDSFLPHGSHKDGKADMQPIWLTTQDENPNKADVLILCKGAQSEHQKDFVLCCELLDGHDQDAVTAARTRWKSYKEQDFKVTYWQQSEAGAWEEKSSST